MRFLSTDISRLEEVMFQGHDLTEISIKESSCTFESKTDTIEFLTFLCSLKKILKIDGLKITLENFIDAEEKELLIESYEIIKDGFPFYTKYLTINSVHGSQNYLKTNYDISDLSLEIKKKTLWNRFKSLFTD